MLAIHVFASHRDVRRIRRRSAAVAAATLYRSFHRGVTHLQPDHQSDIKPDSTKIRENATRSSTR